MSKATVLAGYCAIALCALLLAAEAAAQEAPIILRVEATDWVLYVNDVTNPSQVGRTAGPVAVNAGTRASNFYGSFALADVASINDSPAKGVFVATGQQLFLSPSPTPTQAVGDITRTTYFHTAFEFLKPDGSPIGSIFGSGMFPGAPPPGSPVGAETGNMTIVGGTGAFIGARGTINNIGCFGCRFASQAEDPSMRRINGGGRQQTLIQFFPVFRPEVVIGTSGATIFHNDYSLVTTSSPARAGETLIVYAKGLGPTTPNINPGDLFPSEPLAIATSPVEVLVNGKSSPAINQVGVPGTPDTYRVDFRVPDDTATGMATLQLVAAWIKGGPVSIPVR